ncbi:MAG: flagellar biosynthesis anti-sigma factor FlgM [Candidatus Sulfotelmatobacter sp.]|jgi:flagellar biosynthesis anti-sigma factor FlgM
MRIDPNAVAQPLLESSRSGSQSPASASTRSSVGNSLGEDQAEVSGIQVQVQALAAQASQLPETRQEKVNALRQAVLDGSYQPSSTQVAEGLFTHMAVKAA